MTNKNYLIGFLWSPARHLWEPILSEINKEYRIEKFHIYDFEEHRNILEQCVIDIYETDDISIDKIKNVKLASMRKFSNEFLMFYVDVGDPQYRKKQSTGNNISRVVERIKKKVREGYKDRVNGYIHDVIIHVADNDTQTLEIAKDIVKYQQFVTNEFVNLKTFLGSQLVDGEFGRTDTLVRAYSARNYLQDKSFAFSLYKKMQLFRVGNIPSPEHRVEVFKSLIHSFEQSGYNEKYPIPCSFSYFVCGGSHRLALAYNKKYDFIPVQKLPTNGIIYPLSWFEKNKAFDTGEIDVIKKEHENLLTFLKQ